MLITSRNLERQLEQLLEEEIMITNLGKRILRKRLENEALKTSDDIVKRKPRRASGLAFSDDEDGQLRSRRERPTSRTRATSAPKTVTVPRNLSAEALLLRTQAEAEARRREIGRPNSRVTLAPPISNTDAANQEIQNQNTATEEDQRWSAPGSVPPSGLPHIEAHVTDAFLSEATLPAEIFPGGHRERQHFIL